MVLDGKSEIGANVLSDLFYLICWKYLFRSVLDGNSEIGAHVLSDLFYLICLRYSYSIASQYTSNI